MTNKIDRKNENLLPSPARALRQFDKLVGSWSIDGVDTEGATITGHEKYEWINGGFFLKQEAEQHYAGLKITSLQVIGFFREWGNEIPNNQCTSHFFDNLGNAWEYVWEIDGETITIWTGYRGAPAWYSGSFSNNGNTLTGKWQWPGGGYTLILTRIL